MAFKYTLEQLKKTLVKNFVASGIVAFIATFLAIVQLQFRARGFLLVVSLISLFVLTYLIYFLVVCIFQFVFFYVHFSKQKSVLAIYEQKGICNEYADEFKRINIEGKYASNECKLNLAEIYLTLGRYDESFLMFKAVNPSALSAVNRCVYFNDIAYFSAKKGNLAEATAILNDNAGFMRDNLGTKRVHSCAVADTAAYVAALKGEYGKALAILAQIPARANDIPYVSILTRYVYIYAKAGDMTSMQKAKAYAETYISQIKTFPYQWSKDHMIASLEIAALGKSY